MEKYYSRTILVIFISILTCPFVWAQISSSTGAVQGSVTDPQNSAIAGAKVVPHQYCYRDFS